jgi:hypothetical protein
MVSEGKWLYSLRFFQNKGFKVGRSLYACHSEGATRSSLMVEKKISFTMQFETTATEESPVSSRQKKSVLTWSGKKTDCAFGNVEILRRPVIVDQTINFGVGLLRMTYFSTRSTS